MHFQRKIITSPSCIHFQFTKRIHLLHSFFFLLFLFIVLLTELPKYRPTEAPKRISALSASRSQVQAGESTAQAEQAPQAEYHYTQASEQVRGNPREANDACGPLAADCGIVIEHPFGRSPVSVIRGRECLLKKRFGLGKVSFPNQRKEFVPQTDKICPHYLEFVIVPPVLRSVNILTVIGQS